MTYHENAMDALAENLNKVLQDIYQKQMGFALLIFELNKPGIGHYVSNAQRASMIKALRETADRLENSQEIPRTIGEA